MLKQKKSVTFHVAIKSFNVTSFIGDAVYSRFQLKKSLKRVRRTKPEAFGGRFVSYY